MVETTVFDQLEQLQQGALQTLGGIDDGTALQAWHADTLGKKGALTALLRQTGTLPAEERPTFGARANDVKLRLTAAYEDRERQIAERELEARLASGAIDVTLPGRARRVGGLHPSTRTLQDFARIWAEMGFQVYRSREVEDDDTNFTLLNMPPHHPARDMQDTFYTTEPGVILRTHTSPGQIRAMRELGANGTRPVRVVLPGMCYRFEQITVRSEVQFHQVEGIAVGRNIHLSDLKGTMSEFARRLFGPETRVRFRGSYFPFTEPSLEVDVASDDERLTKGTGWLEIAGCGMIHPTVLANGGYDPAEWSGFAFGCGPERMTMQRHDIRDIRYFWANDLRFLEQF